MSGHGAERDIFLQLLDAEIDRRRLQEMVERGGDPRISLERTLDEMAVRLRGAPDWKEPSASERRRSAHKVEMWFRRKGYGCDTV
jgi:hypothetical protein